MPRAAMRWYSIMSARCEPTFPISTNSWYARCFTSFTRRSLLFAMFATASAAGTFRLAMESFAARNSLLRLFVSATLSPNSLTTPRRAMQVSADFSTLVSSTKKAVSKRYFINPSMSVATALCAWSTFSASLLISSSAWCRIALFFVLLSASVHSHSPSSTITCLAASIVAATASSETLGRSSARSLPLLYVMSCRTNSGVTTAAAPSSWPAITVAVLSAWNCRLLSLAAVQVRIVATPPCLTTCAVHASSLHRNMSPRAQAFWGSGRVALLSCAKKFGSSSLDGGASMTFSARALTLDTPHPIWAVLHSSRGPKPRRRAATA
mmetsp:Transcript_1285/g.4292  ORF Transcript_1285/g.4292 Transcript_1285/m.4292 type:complete len:323 (+) Transcript_1285:1328-2296(+)